MRPRKAERDQLTALLDAPWDSVDDLANAAFALVVEQVLARDWWLTVAASEDALWVHGPYSTRKRALDGLPATMIPAHVNYRVFIRQIVTATADMRDGQQELTYA